MKFVRRSDLSPETRARIALQVLTHRGEWGIVTQLARIHRVSRQFIYTLVWSVIGVFEPQSCPVRKPEHEVVVPWDRLVIALKLQGSCSVGDIAQMLRTLGVPKNSVGSVSQRIHDYAAALPDETPPVSRAIVVLVDETFAAGKPLLVVVEGRSHYILKAVVAEDRQGETWCKLLKQLQDQGHVIHYGVGDQGSGLRRGLALARLAHCPDLMHLIHPFSVFPSRFERQAYHAIAREYDREQVLDSARSQAVVEKRVEEHDLAVQQANRAMDRYDDYAYLWSEFLRAFDPFDPEGVVRTRAVVEGDVHTVLDLMDSEFDVAELHQAVRRFRKAVEEYWSYFDRVQAIVEDLSQHLPQDVLRELCLAWQAEKRSRAAKDYRRKKALEQQAADHCLLASSGDVEDVEGAKQLVFDRLEDNVRSSSPLESINSLIRDYLNSSRCQITQDVLDLIVYYLNHKIASRGPYQGTSAWERFTGKPEEGTYVDQILDHLNKSA